MLRDMPLANEKHQCWSIKKILDLKSSASITESIGFFCPAPSADGQKDKFPLSPLSLW